MAATALLARAEGAESTALTAASAAVAECVVAAACIGLCGWRARYACPLRMPMAPHTYLTHEREHDTGGRGLLLHVSPDRNLP